MDTIINFALTDSNAHKRKCLTISEYNNLCTQLDAWINEDDFILNKAGLLTIRALAKYSYLYKYTVLSIIDARIQNYVCKRHYKVFNNSNNNSPVHVSKTKPCSTTSSPIHSSSSNNKHLIHTVNSLYSRYKELVVRGDVTCALITLADNLRMPAMLVAKNVLEDFLAEEKIKNQMEACFHNLSEQSIPTPNTSVTNTFDNELDIADNVDIELSQSLSWLSSKLLSMRKVVPPVDELNQSNNSSTNSCPFYEIKSKQQTPHQLANSTWLIRADPQLAYQVFKCSVLDIYYGSCVEFIKSCSGHRYEQLLKENINLMFTGNKEIDPDGTKLYTTEKECRLRGLDVTPDMVLHEPIAILLSKDNNVTGEYNVHTATHYVGKNDKEIRVLNWLESKAMFGGVDQLRNVMPRQLFPYWNRYGPGAVIYWFGHILEDGELDQVIHRGVSVDKIHCDAGATESVDTTTKTTTKSTESSTFNFYSKYCLLMDGFPESNRIVQYNDNDNNQTFNLT